jgi:glycosyltransferase involved in cell wall biosynthesis
VKILIANWKDVRHPDAGGAEQVAHELAKRYVLRGDHVTMLTSRPAQSSLIDKIDGIEIIRIGRSRFLHPFMAHLFYRIFLKNDFDLVIESINTSPYFLGLISDRAEKVQLYYQLAREVWFYELPPFLARLGFHILEPIALYLNSIPKNLVMSISKSTSDDLKKFGYHNHQIKTFTIGMSQRPKSVDEVGKDKAAIFTVLFHSSLRDMKRPTHIVEAFSELIKSGTKARLWMSGGGDQTAIRDMIRSLNLTQDVTIFGRVSNEQKAQLMCQASVICCTSIKEGWGIIVSEANGQGTPAIVYDIDGLRDAAAYSGSLVCEPNPSSMAKALQGLALMFYEEHEQYLKLCRSVWQKVLHFNFDSSFDSFDKVIQERMKNRHSIQISSASGGEV